jgi:hypothetical protein
MTEKGREEAKGRMLTTMTAIIAIISGGARERGSTWTVPIPMKVRSQMTSGGNP